MRTFNLDERVSGYGHRVKDEVVSFVELNLQLLLPKKVVGFLEVESHLVFPDLLPGIRALANYELLVNFDFLIFLLEE